MSQIPNENAMLTHLHSACMDAINDRLIAMQDETAAIYKERLATLTAAIERGGLDISLCRGCNRDVVCIPDGLPFCEDCAIAEAKRQ